MDVVSDCGPQFVSRFWRAFCSLIGATASLSSGYHPQSNGQTKCLNQELEKGHRCTVAQTPGSWSQKLVWVEFAHVSTFCVNKFVSVRVCLWLPSSPVPCSREGGWHAVCNSTHPKMSSHMDKGENNITSDLLIVQGHGQLPSHQGAFISS